MLFTHSSIWLVLMLETNTLPLFFLRTFLQILGSRWISSLETRISNLEFRHYVNPNNVHKFPSNNFLIDVTCMTFHILSQITYTIHMMSKGKHFIMELMRLSFLSLTNTNSDKSSTTVLNISKNQLQLSLFSPYSTPKAK